MARKPIVFDNTHVVKKINHYCKLKDATDDYPVLDDVLNGVANLDYDGNTRPLCIKKLFNLLATVPSISTQAVQDATQQSLSHCKRLCTALRIASKELGKHWANSQSMLDSALA